MSESEAMLFNMCCNIDYDTAGNDVNYKFVENGQQLYIYFQGSSSVLDWIRNFMFKKKPYKDMKVPYKVHRGFLAAWKEVEDIVIKKIVEPETRDSDNFKWKQITIVGYSHGAALAAFCHECVWFWRPDLRMPGGLFSIAFEAPRIFGAWKVPSELTCRWQTFFVIRNKNDIVTHCPPALFRFCHVGTVLKIGKGVKLHRHTWFRCVDAHYPDNVEESLLAK